MKIAKLKKGLPREASAKWGFTILETIISVAILGAVIGGVSGVVRSNIVALSIAKEEVKAFYLAQEAVEMIRNKKDSNELDSLVGGSNTWLTGIASQASDPCFPPNTCYADAYTSSFARCSGSWGTCPVLRQDTSAASASYLIHGYNAGWATTVYRREIQIESISANEIAVTVQVSWSHAGINKSFKTKTILTNWF